MAEENTEMQATVADSSKNTTIKLIIAGIITIIIVAAVSFVVAMYAAKTVAKVEPPKGDGYGVVKSDTLGTTYDAGEYITNLNSKAGDRFIKAKIVFAFQDTKVQDEIANKLPQIQQKINSTLREQTPEFLSQPKAMEKLAETLRKNINSLLVKGNITEVYFTSFVVQ